MALVATACFRPDFWVAAGAFRLALLVAEGPVLPTGTRPGAAALRGGTAAALVRTGTLALAVASLTFGCEVAGFGGAGQIVRVLGFGVRACWFVVTVFVAGVTAARVAVRARLDASRRRREAGEPGRRCARRERWLALDGGRASFGVGARAGTVAGRGMEVEVEVGVVQGLDGLGHLRDGSGQTGLLGWAGAPRGDGLSFSLGAEPGSGRAEDGAVDGVGALCWTGLSDSLEELPTGVVGTEEEPLFATGKGSWVGFLGEEGATWRFFLSAVAEPFRGSVGVQAGEAA